MKKIKYYKRSFLLTNYCKGLSFQSVIIFSIVAIMLFCTSCKKFIEVNAPVTNLNSANVFESDATAASALTGIYAQMSVDNKSMNGLSYMSVLPGLSSDEYGLYTTNTDPAINAYYKNSLTSTLTNFSNVWNKGYYYIYLANAAIEGLNSSKNLTTQLKMHLLGEAYFMRAFCYFYLTNLYGDVPLVTTTDYKINAALGKSTKSDILKQVIADLKSAQLMLSDKFLKGDAATTYPVGQEERVRPNLYAANSLLARVQLFAGNYVDAELQSSAVIHNKSTFDTVGLNQVFLKNSKETIWSLQPIGSSTQSNTGEGVLFIPTTSSFPSSTNYLYINDDLYRSFDPSDKRLSNWLKRITTGGIDYYYPFKYKVGSVNTVTTEYSIIFRIAEQYLIRAEARARQNNLVGSLDDLNLIRKRAGLSSLTLTTQNQILESIMLERRHELFSEWGHRWLDLKRTNTVDAIMNKITPIKGGTWNSNWALYPIPSNEIQQNPNLVQNQGYN